MMNTICKALVLPLAALVLPSVANSTPQPPLFSIQKACVNADGPIKCTGTFYFSVEYDGNLQFTAQLSGENNYSYENRESLESISNGQIVKVTEADPSPDWMLTAIACPTCSGQPSFASSQPIIDIGERYIEFWFVGGEQITFTNQAVPIPAAAWLFMSGILGLTGIARRKKSDC